MPSRDYTEWAGRHGAAFGLTQPRDADMLVEWADHFERRGHGPDELQAATEALMLDPPEYREQHLRALHRLLANARARLAAPPPADEGCDCNLCGGSGQAVVPSRKARARGRWATEGVACRCPLGLWLRHNGLQRHTTLERYEMDVPEWRDILRQHEEALLAEARMAGAARHSDEIAGRLAVRFGASAAGRAGR